MIEVVSTWLTPEIRQFYDDTKSLRLPYMIEGANGEPGKWFKGDFDRIRTWFGWEGALLTIAARRGECRRVGGGVMVWHIGEPTGTRKAISALNDMTRSVSGAA